jgi:hypothetical protein
VSDGKVSDVAVRPATDVSFLAINEEYRTDKRASKELGTYFLL